MSDLELIALAASDPAGAVPRIRELIRLHLRSPPADTIGYPVSVEMGSAKSSFSVSFVTSAFSLTCEVDFRALSEVVFDFRKLFERVGESFNRRSEIHLRGLFSSDKNVQCRDVLDVELPKTTLKTGIEDSIASHIVESRSLLVLGPSSSGKTTAVVAACKTLAAQRRTRSLYCDLSLGLPAVSQLFEFALSASEEPHRERIVVLDNVHAQIAALPMISELREVCQMLGATNFVLISWPSARAMISGSFGEIDQFSISGDKVISEINLHSKVPLANQQLVEIQGLAKGDVLVGATLLESFRRQGRVLAEADIHKLLLDELRVPDLSPELEGCLLDVCRINSLDIPVKFSYLVQKYSTGVDDLIRGGLLRTEGEYVRIGHRSRARLLHAALVNRRLGKGHGSVSDALFVDSVLDYFRTLRRDELFSILAAVDAAIAESEPDNKNRTKFSAILRSVSTLVRQLEYAQRNDISWGNNFASAVFSALAFSWASPREWQRLADSIRAAVAVDESGLSFPHGVGSERKDFDQIVLTMTEEDGVLGGRRPRTWEPASSLDPDVAYRNWLVGLLLCFEGSAVRPDRLRRRRLLALAEKYALPNGGYYPKRVPWITARVLMGLGACGETVETSEHVSRSTQWLLSLDRSGSIAPTGLWPSGTGTWNTPEQCTAMVILALRSVGVAHQQIVGVSEVELLRVKLRGFSLEKDQIDILTTLECLSEYGAFDSESGEILNAVVEQYCEGISTNVSSIDSVVAHEESSKSPFVVNCLLSILWEQLARTLDSTLSSLGSVFKAQQTLVELLPQARPAVFDKCEQLLARLDLVQSEKQKAILRARSASIDDDVIARLREPIDRIERGGNSLRELYRKCVADFEAKAQISGASELERAVGKVIGDLVDIVPYE